MVANLRNLAVAELRAATDGLTGLANQRTVHETLKRTAAQAGRTASPLALVLFDLDHFKAVNDTYGHGKGDDVLAAVGAVAPAPSAPATSSGASAARSSPPCCRTPTAPAALEAAEKIRAAIAAIPYPASTAHHRVLRRRRAARRCGEPDLLLRGRRPGALRREEGRPRPREASRRRRPVQPEPAA